MIYIVDVYNRPELLDELLVHHQPEGEERVSLQVPNNNNNSNNNNNNNNKYEYYYY